MQPSRSRLMRSCATPLPPQRDAAACGQLPIGLPGANLTLSIISLASTAECEQLAALEAGSGGQDATSCARCPQLAAGAPYTIWLVPSGAEGGVGRLASVKVATGADWVSSTPAVVSRGGGSNDTAIAAARVAPAGESSFNLSFSLTRPGTLHFLVLYSSLVARYVDTYVAFDNAPSDATALLTSDLAAFSNGVVARGSCAVAAAGATASCRFGPAAADGADGGDYACSPAVSCRLQNTCFGSLCDYSRYGIVPNSTYKVRARWQCLV